MISVVIPLYNGEKTITRTLNSVKNQTALDAICEIIVVDDGSTDKSTEIVQKYHVKNPTLPIRLLQKANGGVSTARNAGMTAATGEWIALLDADDEWFPEKTERQIEQIQMEPNIDFIGGDFSDQGVSILGRKITALHRATVKEVCIKMFPQASTVIFRRKIFLEIGGFNATMRYAEDGNYFIKICNHYGYYYLPGQVIVYGDNKRGFGVSGLSANLRKMYQGNVDNIRELRQTHVITLRFFMFLRVFYLLKYWRRILIVMMQKARLNKR